MHRHATSRRHRLPGASTNCLAGAATIAALAAATAPSAHSAHTALAGGSDRFWTGDDCWTPEGSPPGLSGRAGLHYGPGDPGLAPGPGDRLVFGAPGFPGDGTVLFNAYCDDFTRPAGCGAGPTSTGVAICTPDAAFAAVDIRRGGWFLDFAGTWCGPDCSDAADPDCAADCGIALPLVVDLDTFDAASGTGDATVDVLLPPAGGELTTGAMRSAHLPGTRGTITVFGPGTLNAGDLETGTAADAIGGLGLRSGTVASATSVSVGTLGSGQFRVRDATLDGGGSAILTGGTGPGASSQITVDDGGAMLEFGGMNLGGGDGAFTELLVDDASRVGVTGAAGIELSAGGTLITDRLSATRLANPSVGTVATSRLAWRVGTAGDPNPLVTTNVTADLAGMTLDVDLTAPLAAGDDRLLLTAPAITGVGASATLTATAGSDVPYLVISSTEVRVAAHRLGDADLDGTVSFTDILQVISQFGPCVGCPEDQDLNGQVAFEDILFVLSEFD